MGLFKRKDPERWKKYTRNGEELFKIQVYVTENQLYIIQRKAGSMGFSTSAFLRYLGLKAKL